MFVIFCSVGAARALAQGHQPTSQKAVIVTDDAIIYKNADFDSEVLAHLPAGKTFDISTKTKGAFYKIRVKPGVVGWIADSDVKVAAGKAVAAKEAKKDSEVAGGDDGEKGFDENEGVDFLFQRYRGLMLENINWTENTLGSRRRENLLFYGFGWTGYNTLFSGELYTTSEILLHFGAPNYYKDVTGESATGFIIKPHFTFENVFYDQKTTLAYYGFGPTLTYSHFDSALNVSGTKANYSMDDMTFGLLLSLGAAVRIHSFSPRIEVKYYWEKEQYFGLNVALLGLF